MLSKTVFLVMISGLVVSIAAEMHVEQAQSCDVHYVGEIDNSTRSCGACEVNNCCPAREQQAPVENDPSIQSCIAEAIEEKYCS